MHHFQLRSVDELEGTGNAVAAEDARKAEDVINEANPLEGSVEVAVHEGRVLALEPTGISAEAALVVRQDKRDCGTRHDGADRDPRELKNVGANDDKCEDAAANEGLLDHGVGERPRPTSPRRCSNGREAALALADRHGRMGEGPLSES